MQQRTTLSYDGSWVGLLTAIFEVYEYKFDAASIQQMAQADQGDLFGARHEVHTDHAKAERVKKGVINRVGKKDFQELYAAYLSELQGVEDLILRLVRNYLAPDGVGLSQNYGHEDVLRIKQINKSVSRERHRFKAFVRFRKLSDELFFAKIDPDFNILPLIIPHFRDRYADQSWVIYDIKRDYGAYYNQSEVVEIHLSDLPSEREIMERGEDKEALYDELWRRYFRSTNITERKNTKLHLQHVPKRYWKYLNEKFDL
ncbi:TIGR03915 family putative DNA repair protein [Sphingobacterium sp. lm-10]|uniref:TIGR03915 family putative DNA repair protein n=1 Tax=Sphingobacterium sp. lm-10 TaxID=2944904 RepID=UPI0020207384|nr:TIGR03915 family putative DNA repair protein [Sphingobacterium sp. lm-10]MCL7986526.1 TIGR03915 family putative DNA repair protein [Sphingobacterium sp. lm-10]